MTDFAENHLKHLPQGHMVVLYYDELEITGLLVDYIKLNLERNIRCIYITGDTNTTAVVKGLEAVIDYKGYCEKNQLLMLDKNESYSKSGEFVPEQMVDLLEEETKKSIAEGFDGLAVTGEISWVLEFKGGFEKIMEYEWKLNDRLFSKHPVSSICRYNMNKFSYEMIIGIIQVHPFIIMENEVHENPFYIPPEGYKLNQVDKYQVETWLNNIKLYKNKKSKFNLELRKKDAEIIESDERYEYIFNNSSVGNSITSIEGKVSVNDTFCKMLGYTKDEIEGSQWHDITHPDDISVSEDAVRKLIEGKESIVRFTKRYIKKDGAIMWADVHTSLRRDTFENPLYFMTTIIDITKQKAAEEENERNNELMRLMFDNAPLPYQSLDENGKFITVNNAWVELFGYSKNEIRGKWFGDFINPEFIEYFNKKFTEFKSKGSIVSEFIIPKKNGELIKIEYNGRIGYDKEGNFRQTHCTMHDVTEEHKFMQFIQRKDEEQSLLLNELEIGIVVHAKDTRIVFANSQAEKLFKLGKVQMEGRSVSDDYWNFVDSNGKELPVDEYPVSKVLRTKSKIINYKMGITVGTSPDIKWFNINGFPILSEDGEIDRIVISFLDETEKIIREKKRIALESQLRNQQKLESIGTLASGVAHEINNPINGIMNYGQIILDSEPGDQMIKEYAKEIVHETNRIAEIVRNLLNFSRKSGQEHSYARIEDIISQTLSLINTVMKKDQIVMSIDIDENLSPIKCRSQQIQQVIMNLLTNAHDALNERYSAYDENKIIKLNCCQTHRENRNWIKISVEDHGIGIPEGIRDNVFDPFFTTKGRDKGTGLGLSISYGIVKDHHGTMSFESVLNEYTRFDIELPCDNGWDLNS